LSSSTTPITYTKTHTNMANGIVQHGRSPQAKGRQFRTYNIMVILAMSFGSIAMGYSGSIIGSTLAQDSFYDYFALKTRPDGTGLLSAMNGLFQAGAFFGALCISWVGDRWGRKWSITIPAMLVVLSGALLAGSVHIGMFLAFRFFSGMGSFWLLGAIPVWMTEIVPPRNRGLLVDIHSAALLFGYALASWCGFGFFHVKTIDAWRGPLALQCLPALIVIGVMKFLPESPRWLIQKGRHDQAHRVLSKLHQPAEAAIEFTQIEAQLQLDNALPSTWMSLITKPSYRKRALYAVGLACGIQFTGVLVINSMSPSPWSAYYMRRKMRC
jgi:MFS family permease